MAITGLGIVAVCGVVSGAISRYYWIRPELTQAGLKILAKGSLIGLAMQTTAIVAGIIGYKTVPKNAISDQQATRFYIGYTIAMVASIPAAVALAGRLDFKLSYKEVITTATLASALFWAVVNVIDQ